MNKNDSFTYTGHENLLAMQHARNYNAFLGKAIGKYGQNYETVVDFGAGVGALAGEAKKWAPRLICVEPDPKQINILQAEGFEAIPDISVLPDGSVDYVYSVNVLEHIDEDIVMIRDIFSKLRVGGRFLIYVPALQWLFSSMDKKVGHVRRYSRNDLDKKLRDQGYRIIHSKYVDSLGVLATLAYKWFGDKQEGSLSIPALKFYDRFLFPVSLVLDWVFNKLVGKNLLIVCEKE
jgi:SAM-dependent methyltransferase